MDKQVKTRYTKEQVQPKAGSIGPDVPGGRFLKVPKFSGRRMHGEQYGGIVVLIENIPNG